MAGLGGDSDQNPGAGVNKPGGESAKHWERTSQGVNQLGGEMAKEQKKPDTDLC